MLILVVVDDDDGCDGSPTNKRGNRTLTYGNAVVNFCASSTTSRAPGCLLLIMCWSSALSPFVVHILKGKDNSVMP